MVYYRVDTLSYAYTPRVGVLHQVGTVLPVTAKHVLFSLSFFLSIYLFIYLYLSIYLSLSHTHSSVGYAFTYQYIVHILYKHTQSLDTLARVVLFIDFQIDGVAELGIEFLFQIVHLSFDGRDLRSRFLNSLTCCLSFFFYERLRVVVTRVHKYIADFDAVNQKVRQCHQEKERIACLPPGTGNFLCFFFHFLLSFLIRKEREEITAESKTERRETRSRERERERVVLCRKQAQHRTYMQASSSKRVSISPSASSKFARFFCKNNTTRCETIGID